MRAENKRTFAVRYVGVLPGMADDVEWVLGCLREAVAKSFERVLETFRKWDKDNSGQIDKKEFRQAVQTLNIATDVKSIDAAFDSLDKDRSGAISYHECVCATGSPQ